MPAKRRKPSPETSEGSRLSRGRSRPEATFPVAPPVSSLPGSYAATLREIKTLLRSARVRAVLAANPIVIEAYWQTGKIILARQQEAAWGAKVIDRLAADLQAEFPTIRFIFRRQGGEFLIGINTRVGQDSTSADSHRQEAHQILFLLLGKGFGSGFNFKK